MPVAWQYPIFYVVALIAGAFVAWALLRLGDPRTRRGRPTYLCTVCERKQTLLQAKEWRYCPYCGAPKNGTLKDLPKRRSVLDIES